MTTRIRTHVSPSPESISLRDVEQVKDSGSFSKPRGFWYEVDGDWRRWCEAENFGLDKYQHIHEIDLGGCNVLVVSSLDELDRFHAKYATIDHRGFGRELKIDWAKVAGEFDGLEIAPYQWARRLAYGFNWYYGWDCASGVIWRPRDVAVIYSGPVQLEPVTWDAMFGKGSK